MGSFLVVSGQSQISPDGSKVVFVAFDPQKGFGRYIVSMQGGTPQRMVEETSFAAWSPDGNELVLEAGLPHLVLGTEIRTIDLRTGIVREIPDSRGTLKPFWPNPARWSPGPPPVW